MKGEIKIKNKILIFVIGFLVGAIVATGVFLIYTKVNASNNITNTTQNDQMPGGNPPEMNGEQPPELPDGQRPDMNGQEPPEKQNGETNTKSHSKKTTSNTIESN